jgi:hypothetical protein
VESEGSDMVSAVKYEDGERWCVHEISESADRFVLRHCEADLQEEVKNAALPCCNC